MRKFLIKHFVLDYWFTLLGRRYNAPRASRIIFPLFVITGLVHTLEPSILSWCLIGLTVVSLYLGFVHFTLPWNKVKWEELDDIQKYQYGYAKRLTNEQFKEWLIIVKKIVGSQ